MREKKLLTSRQIFRYAVPARTVTKKHCVGYCYLIITALTLHQIYTVRSKATEETVLSRRVGQCELSIKKKGQTDGRTCKHQIFALRFLL